MAEQNTLCSKLIQTVRVEKAALVSKGQSAGGQQQAVRCRVSVLACSTQRDKSIEYLCPFCRKLSFENATNSTEASGTQVGIVLTALGRAQACGQAGGASALSGLVVVSIQCLRRPSELCPLVVEPLFIWEKGRENALAVEEVLRAARSHYTLFFCHRCGALTGSTLHSLAGPNGPLSMEHSSKIEVSPHSLAHSLHFGCRRN